MSVRAEITPEQFLDQLDQRPISRVFVETFNKYTGSDTFFENYHGNITLLGSPYEGEVRGTLGLSYREFDDDLSLNTYFGRADHIYDSIQRSSTSGLGPHTFMFDFVTDISAEPWTPYYQHDRFGVHTTSLFTSDPPYMRDFAAWALKVMADHVARRNAVIDSLRQPQS